VGPATANPALVQIGNGGFFVGNNFVTYSMPAYPSSTVARTASLNIASLGGDPTGNVLRPTSDYAIQILQQPATPTQLFQDVPPSYPFFDYVNLIKTVAVANGCSATPAMFCPDTPATREQAAAFIVHAVLGTDTFSYTTTPYFTDVPPSDPLFRFVQKLKDLGITSGCSATAFCPNDSVTRGQIAAFLMRGKFPTSIISTTYLHHSTAAYFTDVPAANPFFSFVQKMRDLGITQGCAATAYCPDNPVTRAQLSVFTIRLFYTPLVSFE
jgi:hypothetical protein